MTTLLVAVVGYPFAGQLGAAPGNGMCCGERNQLCCGCQYYLVDTYVQLNTAGVDKCKLSNNQNDLCENEYVQCFFAQSVTLYDDLGPPTINPCSRTCINPVGTVQVNKSTDQCKGGFSPYATPE
jgi:hypothetical protein